MGCPAFLSYTLAGLVCPFLLFFTKVLTVLGHRRLQGATVDPPHKYPWMVSIFRVDCFDEGACNTSAHVCGGSLVSDHYIVTAAHCCFRSLNAKAPSVEGLYVLTGLHQLGHLQPWSQNLSVAECIVHELYENKDDATQNDIALVRVNGKIEFSHKVTPVNLPSPDFAVDKDGDVIAIQIGWGLTTWPGYEVAKELQQRELPLITTDTCQRAFGLLSLNEEKVSAVVTESMICAGYAEKQTSACFADSGSPVMVLNSSTKTYTQIGIVSWTVLPCGSSYTVCVSLSSYVHWISHHLQRCKPRESARSQHSTFLDKTNGEGKFSTFSSGFTCNTTGLIFMTFLVLILCYSSAKVRLKKH